jgi:hypothetical protein
MDIKERHEKRKTVENELVRLEEKKKDLQITIKILNSNAKIALFNDTLPIVLEVLAKYKNKPYTCKEVNFLFYKDDYKIVLTADNKKEMYIKLLELYESGLNNWIETYNNDHYKTKKEIHRLNVHKKLLLELNKVVDR